mgnify:CR=1 FL=1
MAQTLSTMLELGTTAPDFRLPDINGKLVSRDDFKSASALLVMFVCNHCPYVKHIQAGLVQLAKDYQPKGVAIVAISSNDPTDYPEDSFDNMKKLAAELKLPFPYLYDESQVVAKTYGAVCTPDFFGYNKDLKLQYRGRLDESRKDAVPNARRELFEAMKQIATTGQGPREQIPSMGCSIKWKGEAA